MNDPEKQRKWMVGCLACFIAFLILVGIALTLIL